jgi:hypothetical protein
MKISEKVKGSFYTLNTKLENFIDFVAYEAAKHPLAFKAAVIGLPAIIAGTLTLEHLATTASADPATITGSITHESYNVGPDGIKGTSDDFYTIQVKENKLFDNQVYDIRFNASQLGPAKLAALDQTYGPGEHEISGVTVTADYVDGNYIGKDITRDETYDGCGWAMGGALAIVLGGAGIYIASNRIHNWREKRRAKKAKVKDKSA